MNTFWEINTGENSIMINVNQIVSITPINENIHLQGVSLKMSNSEDVEILDMDYCEVTSFLRKNNNVNIKSIGKEYVYD